MSKKASEFNDSLRADIDDSVEEVLGRNVLDTLHTVLSTKFDITRDEIPYRTDTLFQILETTFGVRGAKTVGTHIAKKFYQKLGICFYEHEGYSLVDYIEVAKTKVNQETPP